MTKRKTHAARQLPDGWWTSKLGPDEDILHRTPQGLAGDLYGHVRMVMKRSRPTSPNDITGSE